MSKKSPLLLCVALLIFGCGGLGNFQDQLNDAVALQKIFQAENCNVNSTVSTEGNSMTVKLTNIGDNKYSTLSPERYFSCVAYEYAQLKTDSVLQAMRGVTVEIGTESKNGFVTNSNSQSEHYSYEELKRMDSLFTIANAYLREVFAAQSFKTAEVFYDTAYVKDSSMMVVDSLFAPVFPQEIVTMTFFGYEVRNEYEADAVTVELTTQTDVNVLRFIFKEESNRFIQIDLNPSTQK